MILHDRTAASLTVAIVCDFETDLLTVEVTDKDGAWVLYPNDGREAMDMFRHPYAYSAGYLNVRRIPIEEEVTA
jgi:hypothetical protein